MSTQPFPAFTLNCPACGRMVRFNLAWFGLFPMRSGLGPSQFVCTRCETVYTSGLQEWSEMGAVRKMNFVFHSLFYAATGGFSTAALILLIQALALAPDTPFIETLNTTALLILWGGLAGVVLLVQALRVNLSLERTLTEALPYRASYLDWQINLQAWVMKIWIAAFITAYLVGRAITS